MIVRYKSLDKTLRQNKRGQKQVTKPASIPVTVQEEVKSFRIGDWHIVEHEGNLVALDKNGNVTPLVSLKEK